MFKSPVGSLFCWGYTIQYRGVVTIHCGKPYLPNKYTYNGTTFWVSNIAVETKTDQTHWEVNILRPLSGLKISWSIFIFPSKLPFFGVHHFDKKTISGFLLVESLGTIAFYLTRSMSPLPRTLLPRSTSATGCGWFFAGNTKTKRFPIGRSGDDVRFRSQEIPSWTWVANHTTGLLSMF